ncbi:hypothetical protein V5799_026849 [Amblyomma americanum]|uniref:Uncharacterized protein n=1 Tax=Amblyomma americanum TaxID=6943 RepID=A0AAQ4DHE2_AMBAM
MGPGRVPTALLAACGSEKSWTPVSRIERHSRRAIFSAALLSQKRGSRENCPPSEAGAFMSRLGASSLVLSRY